MRPNWFVALPVPGGAWLERLPPAPRGVRTFAAADLHATIAFLGAVDETRARAAWEALSWPLGSIDASLGAVVPMGPPERPSALSALLVEGREEVERAMMESRARAWRAAGAREDERPAKAHVTLARPGRRASARERSEALRWAGAIDLGEPRVRLDRVALYTWSADRAERLFEIVCDVTLGRG